MKRLCLLLLLLATNIINGHAQCSTTSAPFMDCSYGDAIHSFTLNSISSTSSGTGGGATYTCINSNGYLLYTSPVFNLSPGQTYSFSATMGTSLYPQGFAIWIDLNNNGNYESSEQLYTSSTTGTSFSGNITIPANATVANGIKMRTRCAWNQTVSSGDACRDATSSPSLGSGYGETEDYNVNIAPPCGIIVSSQPKSASLCSGGGTTFSVTATGVSTYKWQVSTNGGTTWSDVTNTGVYSGAATSTLSLSSVPVTMNTYQYRCVLTNASACSTNSQVAILTVNLTTGITSTSSAGGCTGNPTSVTAVPTTGATVSWYDQSTGGTLLGTGNTLNIASAPASNTNYYAYPVLTPVATSLSVQLAATNNQAGCFMDIKPLKDIKLTDISWLPVSTQSYDISIYFKTGSAIGFETNAAAWTLLTAKTGISATAATLNKITLPTPQTLNANNVYSILVIRTGTSGNISYQTVSVAGSVEASNTDLQLLSASGISGLFTGTVFSPRSFAGAVGYEPVVCPAPARTAVQLIVNAPPTVTTQPGNTAVCKNANVTLTAAFSGAGSYQWEMSTNGGTSWSTVNNGGIYSGATTAALTITGAPSSINNYQYRSKGICTSTATSNAATITVNEPPAITTQPTNTEVCLGENTTISCVATGAGTLAYEWERSLDGGTNWSAVPASAPYSTVNTATLTITGATTFLNNVQYRCKVKGLCNPEATTNAVVLKVNTPPVVTVQPVNQEICPRSTAVFTTTATGAGLAYQWQELTTVWTDISNGGAYSGATTNTLSISNVYAGLSGQQFRCVITGACAPPDTTNDPVLTIKDEPAGVSVGSNTPVCEGKSLELIGNSTSTGVTYSWTGPNGFNANTQNPSVPSPVLANTGNYILTATLTSTNCSVKDSTPVVIKITPAKPVVGSNTPVCTKLDINLTASSTAGATYSWTGQSGFSSNVQNPVRSNAALHMTGYYKVIADINGCVSEPDSTLVTIIPSPEVGAYPSPSNIVCVGDTIIFIGIANHGGTGPTYQWMKNGAAIPGETTLKYPAGGLANGDVITLELTPGTDVSCSSSISSIPIPVTIQPYLPPQVSISSDPAGAVWPGLLVNFIATPTDAGNAPGYQWKRNGQNISGATGQNWSATTLSDNDVIICEITSDYLCPSVPTALSNQIKVTVLTSVANTAKASAISLFPNPNQGSFTLKGNMASAEVDIEILNAVGQVVYRQSAHTRAGELQHNIRLSGLADGIYMVRIHGQGEEASIRFKLTN